MATLRKVISGFTLCTLSTLALALQVEGGITHTAILDDNGALYTSGDNTAGELGHTNVRQGFHKVPSTEKFQFIDASAQQTLAVTDCGKVKVFGRGYGVKYLPFSKSKQAVWSSSNVIALTVNGTIEIYTYRTKAVTTVPLQNIIQIDAGEGFAVALNGQGEVFSWGTLASYGQLGLGHFNAQSTPVKVEGLPSIKKLDAATAHTVALSVDNEAFVFGYNRYGRLGLGHEGNVSVPQKVALENIKGIAAGNAQSLFLTDDGKVYGTGFTLYQDNDRAIYGTMLTPTWFAGSNADQIFAGEGDQQVIVKGTQFKGLGNSRSLMLSLVMNNTMPETKQFTDMFVSEVTVTDLSAPLSCPAVDVAALYAELEALTSELETLSSN